MKKLFQSTLMTLMLCGALTTKAQVPLLSSYPSAQAVIFLDFDGETVENTSWNLNGPIVCGPSGLNTAQMTEVFNRVSEDYRPFNLNVTTDSTKYLSAPIAKRMRIVVTITSDWYGSGHYSITIQKIFQKLHHTKQDIPWVYIISPHMM